MQGATGTEKIEIQSYSHKKLKDKLQKIEIWIEKLLQSPISYYFLS